MRQCGTEPTPGTVLPQRLKPPGEGAGIAGLKPCAAQKPTLESAALRSWTAGAAVPTKGLGGYGAGPRGFYENLILERGVNA